MKRSKRLGILAGILAVTCIATLILSKYEEKQEEIQNSDEVILEVDSDTVSTLSWDYAGETFTFQKDEENWSYEEDEAFPVSSEKISEILAHFEDFGVNFVIENVDDYSQYGLNDPEYTITLTTDEETYEIKLGDFSKMDQQRYVDISDGNVYLVSEDPVEYLPSELSAMILNDETPEIESVTDIQFTGNQDYKINYIKNSKKTYDAKDVYFTDIDGDTVAMDPDTVDTYLETISSLNLESYATYNATEEELKSYGMDEPELSVTVNYSYKNEDEEDVFDTCILHISQNPKELEAANKAEEKNKEEIPEVTKYVRLGDSPIVYIIDDTTYDTLTNVSTSTMRHNEIFWADFALVTKIDITLEDKTHTLTSTLDEKDEDAERVWYYNDDELDIYDLKNAIIGLTKSSFTDLESNEKEEISMTLYLDNEDFPKVTIQLYRYNGTVCLAVVDGKSVAFVSRSDVMELVEAAQSIILN